MKKEDASREPSLYLASLTALLLATWVWLSYDYPLVWGMCTGKPSGVKLPTS